MSLIAELKRRNVFRVAAAYVIVAWVIAQVAEFAFENFGAPDWVLKSVVVILLLGLPLALFFAWAFELTPEGIKREVEVDRSKSIVSQTGRKLDRMIIGVLVLAVGWFAFDKFYTRSVIDEPPVEQVATNDSQLTKSVAVLPFVAMSSGKDDEYFADGLTEEILNSLAQLPELLVTARTSAFSFKGQDLPVQEIADVLGVEHIVEGSVRRSGERVRVTAQLIRANDGFHLWSENYDSTSEDTIAVQENIAEQIAAVLDVVLDERKRELMKAAGLRDVEAFTWYQHALELYDLAHGERETVAGLVEANVYFDKVIERVPTFAQAYIERSDLYSHMLSDYSSGLYQDVFTQQEIEDTYAALVADYEAAERYETATTARYMNNLDIAFISGDWEDMDELLDRALATPTCIQGSWTSIIGDVFGRAEQLIDHFKRRLECDPLSTLSWFMIARSYLNLGDVENSLKYAQEGMEVAPGGWLTSTYVRALAANGQHDAAYEVLKDPATAPDGDHLFMAMLAANTGERELFEQYAQNAAAEGPSGDRYWGVIMSAWGGDRDAANEQAAYIDSHRFGYVTLTLLSEWCGCGAPFDLEATPNFARRVESGDLPWPPAPVLEFPFKRW